MGSLALSSSSWSRLLLGAIGTFASVSKGPRRLAEAERGVRAAARGKERRPPRPRAGCQPRGGGTMARVAAGRAVPAAVSERAHLGDGHLPRLPGTAGLTGARRPLNRLRERSPGEVCGGPRGEIIRQSGPRSRIY
ncbi:unnamed protein product [Rangifer tarandus platyrhynchus]|uniref:Uncharacterized protein n=1 Tax=Rangifer tarandus platyrhynchus TaxID=3082113 RepID=A0ABN8YC12_RANTA|nr:unnamed protein product [Rangifer tarandus platyrhynchus]